MAFTLRGAKEDTPIAITCAQEDRQIVYQTPFNPDEPKQQLPTTSDEDSEADYVCPRCHKHLGSKKGARYHFSHVCHVRTSCGLRLEVPEEIEQLPTPARQVMAVMGSQGSGKTYRVARFIRSWRALWPERPVIFITTHKQPDPTFVAAGAVWDEMTVTHPNISWVADRFRLEDFANALVVFDDVESSSYSDATNPKQQAAENRAIRDYVRALAIDLAENGRHVHSSMIVTSHALYTGSRNDIMNVLLRDATDCVIFPQQTGNGHLLYFLTHHIGLTTGAARRMLSIPSRWLVIHKAAPKYVMWSHGVERYDVMM